MARRIETGSIDIDAIKDQFPLADEVRRHLALKRRGAALVGLCPFHMERTPSLAVYFGLFLAEWGNWAGRPSRNTGSFQCRIRSDR